MRQPDVRGVCPDLPDRILMTLEDIRAALTSALGIAAVMMRAAGTCRCTGSYSHSAINIRCLKVGTSQVPKLTRGVATLVFFSINDAWHLLTLQWLK